MFVKFVPLHNGEVKHIKMQVGQDENLSDLREKLKSNFKAEHFKVLFHGRLINDFETTLSHYKVSLNYIHLTGKEIGFTDYFLLLFIHAIFIFLNFR